MLMEDGLHLSHQEVREEDTACFEGLCKTGKHLYDARNKYQAKLSFILKLQQPYTEQTAEQGK